MQSNWVEWHEWYADPDSSHSRRLEVVQRNVATALDELRPGPLRVLSLCAGDGRDLLGVLEGHPRSGDVTAVLVELDEELAARGAERVDELGLAGSVQYLVADAGVPSGYPGSYPADLVLACGIFGNISDRDVECTVRSLALLVAPGGQAIWTRHRKAPDLTVEIRSWFDESGFSELDFVPLEVATKASVGRHRLDAPRVTGAVPAVVFRFLGAPDNDVPLPG